MIEKDTDPSCFSIKYPLNSKVRYIMVYRAKKTSKIDINNPSQIIEKITLAANTDSIFVTIPMTKPDENNTCAITFIDYFGNESAATILN
jgi:hypothetical protein